MFGIFKKKSDVEINKLFRITLHIGRGSNIEMPVHLIGAYVPVFVGATDHESAAMTAVKNITKDGYEFIDIADGKIDELDPHKWNTFVSEAWSDYASIFPTQEKVLAGLSNELFFTGPFAGYENNKTA
jgi:hypothetical protein